jgi:outer membrane cobalamin receptor
VANLSWTTPQFKITYAHRYQSGVTTIIDPLEGFHLGELRAQYIHRNANFFIEIDNLWNANYRVIERRAMPGRNFNLGVNFEIKESHKNLKNK